MHHSARIEPTLAGFTLIEVTLYIALFSIIVVGSIVASLTVIEHSDSNETRTSIAIEAEFLLSKLDYYLLSTESVIYPATGDVCSGENCKLSVVSSGIGGRAISVVFQSNSIHLFVDGEDGGRLHSQRITINSFSVEHKKISANTPGFATLQFSLSALSPNGQVIRQLFETSYGAKKYESTWN